MSHKAAFSRFLGAAPGRLHFAAHSHHPWPDVTFDAHQRAWLDAARLVDDKWAHVLGEVVPAVRERVARVLGLPDPATLVFAPNTHELVLRLASCLPSPMRVLTTDAEFHSFSRQARRWEEAGRAEVERVAAEPYATFGERFAAAASAGGHHLVFLSEVHFDSGYAATDLAEIVHAVADPDSFVVIDGYHSFMARPVDLSAIADRAFFLAGGYKYAMAGEGACFLHAPPGYGLRPVNTGWYAGFGSLESADGSRVDYATDGSRFAGSTFDPSGVYRLGAVLEWLEREGITPAHVSEHVAALHTRFLRARLEVGELLPPDGLARGSFLTFRTPRAAKLDAALHERNVIVDHRRDRLRFGFGLYHDDGDVDQLVEVLAEVMSLS